MEVLFNKIFKSFKKDAMPKGVFKAIIAPRPIGWISSFSEKTKHNLAPFSYFNAVCDNPPTVMVSFTDQHVEFGEKDTLKNIEETKHFVINLVTYELYSQMNLTSTNLPRNVDEFTHFGISWLTSEYGESRRVADSLIQLECNYCQSVDLPKESPQFVNRMIIGTVTSIHIEQNILDDNNKINYEKLQLIARLGYNDYLIVGPDNIFSGQRPKI